MLLSTHQTEDVAALCHRVVVLDGGAARSTAPRASSPTSPRPGVARRRARPAGAGSSWRTGDGRHRHIGDPPAGADLVDPTLEDGYLLLRGGVAHAVAA